MISSVRNRIWVVAFFILCSVPTLLAGWQMHDWGDRLSPADSYSEANALREVDGFRAQGIWRDAGLGNVLFGNRYVAEGFTATPEDRATSVLPNGIYTHYPPGPEYLLYVAEAVFGPHPVSKLRLLPLLVCWGPAVFLGFSIRRRFGADVGWLAMLALTSVTTFYNANSSIHFLGYALALLLVEFGIAIGRNRSVLPFLVLGFLQGWLSFDYIFLVVFAPLGLALALPEIEPGEPRELRLALTRCAMAGTGFALAHLVHLGQVWAYYGSLGQALNDFLNSARFRSGAAQTHGVMNYVAKSALIILYYTVSPHPIVEPVWRTMADGSRPDHTFRFLGMTLGAWFPIVTLTLWVVDIRYGKMNDGRKLVPRWLKICAIGLSVSSMWWLVMQNHALVHTHLLYRHLNFAFFVAVLFLSVIIARSVRNGRAAASS